MATGAGRLLDPDRGRVKDPARSTREHDRWRFPRHAPPGRHRHPRADSRHARRKQQMIEPHAFVRSPAVALVIPERPERSVRVQFPQSIRPALRQQPGERLRGSEVGSMHCYPTIALDKYPAPLGTTL